MSQGDIILVVDDDTDVRGAISELLESDGYRVVAAANGRDALAELRKGVQPCVILLDLMMPVMDGWDFRAAQLRDPDLRGIPVIVITAAGFSADSIKSQLHGVDFLPKPLGDTELLAAVERACPRPSS